jgi:hypothetical protein
MFPITSDWDVEIVPRIFDLAAGGERSVTVNILHAGGKTFTGRQPFNVNIFATDRQDNRVLAGGVTLYVVGT